MKTRDRQKILFVDDSKSVLNAVGDALRQGGFFEVVTCDDPLLALTLVDDSFECVITDFEMPKMNGPQLCKAIRYEKQLHHLPIIVLTGSEKPSSIIEAMDSGADDFLLKSLALDLLTVKIQSMIKLKQLRMHEMEFQSLKVMREMVVTYNHEINNPLTVVLAEMIALGPSITAKQKKKFDRVLHNLERIRDTVARIRILKEYKVTDYSPKQKMVKI